MADQDTGDMSQEGAPREFVDVPAGAQMLSSVGMAQKTPGRCACGEHPDPDSEHAEQAEHGEHGEA